jgi:hypothetical protein
MRPSKLAVHLVVLIPILLSALAASAQTGYDFTVNFSGLPVGSLYQQPEQSLVWNSPLITRQFNGDKSGQLFGIVSCPGGVAGNCLQYRYLDGSIGIQTGLGPQYGVGEEWQVKFPAAPVVNVSYWWMFMPGFPFTSNLGKTGPAIVVGACKVRTDWYPFGQLGALPYQDRFRPYRGDYTNGDAGSTDGAAQMPTWAIQTGVWYFIHEQFASGPNGWAKVWVQQPTDPAPVLFLNVGPRQCGGVWPSGPMMIEGSTYFGGGGLTFSRWSEGWPAFTSDSYAVTFGIRAWTGTGN